MTIFQSVMDRYGLASVPREGEGGGGGGGGEPAPKAEAWTTGLEPELIGHAQNRKWDTLTPAEAARAAVKSHREAEALLGVPQDRVLKLPGAADAPEAWDPVWQRLGAPKDAKEYDTAIAAVKFSDGDPIDENYATSIRTLAAKNHWSPQTTTEVTKELVRLVEEGDKADAAATVDQINQEKAKLVESWGPANVETNMVIAKAGATKLGALVPDLPQAIEALEGKVGYAAVMTLMHAIGSVTGEDTFIRNMNPGGAPALTKEQAAARIGELKRDPEYSSRYLAGGVSEKREMDALHRIAAQGG